MSDNSEIIELTAGIVSAYVSNNSVSAADVSGLIHATYAALNGAGAPPPPAEQAVQNPAVSIKKSIGDDFLICLEDGRKFKSLKRHLRTKYNLTPDAYRAKWGLPKTYPMVAPAYAAARSEIAKNIDLGRGGRGGAPASTSPTVPAAEAAPVAEDAPKVKAASKRAPKSKPALVEA